MAKNTITVVCFQMSVDIEPAQRLSRAIEMMQDAYDKFGSGIYVFSEYYLNHFYENSADTAAAAEPIPGPSTQPLLDFAAETKCTIVMGMLEISDVPNRPFNTAAILGPKGLIGCYRKTHLWDLGPAKESFRECKLFTPGDELNLFDIEGWKVGLMICADGIFPETPRTLALKGADLIIYPNSRERVGIEVEAAVDASLVPIAVSNPVGFNGADQCEGTSRIVGPGVKSLATATDDQQGWAAATLDMDEITKCKTTAYVRTLRRPDLYSILTKKGDL